MAPIAELIRRTFLCTDALLIRESEQAMPMGGFGRLSDTPLERRAFVAMVKQGRMAQARALYYKLIEQAVHECDRIVGDGDGQIGFYMILKQCQMSRPDMLYGRDEARTKRPE